MINSKEINSKLMFWRKRSKISGKLSGLKQHKPLKKYQVCYYAELTLASEKFQNEVFVSIRGILERYLNSKLYWEEKEAAVLVLGIISGFKSEFKQIEPQLK